MTAREETESALVQQLRTFWREVTESDGGESPQMAMTREAADEIDRLRACLRENVIWTNINRPNHGKCGNCLWKWSDGIEAHEPGCLAALTTTEKTDGEV